MRALRYFRYFLAGFEALMTAFALSCFAVGFVVVVQLSVQRAPLDHVKRTVVLTDLGQATVLAVGAGIFAFWMGRCAIRNFRDAKAKQIAAKVE